VVAQRHACDVNQFQRQSDCLSGTTSWPRDVRVQGIVVSGKYLQLYCLYISKLWCFLTSHIPTTNTASKRYMSTDMWLRKVEILVLYASFIPSIQCQNRLKRHDRDWIFCIVINECCYNGGVNRYGLQWGINQYHRASDAIDETSHKPVSLYPRSAIGCMFSFLNFMESQDRINNVKATTGLRLTVTYEDDCRM
jgi:hypothetical protein